ncbi:TPA: hypothetical protein ACGO5M_001881 [Streptococcus suis]
MGLNIKQKLELLPEEILIDKKIINSNIRGVYGIFSCDVNNKNKYCYYIGRAADIRSRFFDAGGHFHNFIWSKSDKEITMKIVENIIKEILKDKKQVKIKVIKEVPYEFDNYYRDMQRLAYEEYKVIEEYQNKNQALHQLPEGKWIKLNRWEDLKDTMKK